MQNLEFMVESDKNHNFLLYLKTKLDIEVDEHLYDSFSASPTRKYRSLYQGEFQDRSTIKTVTTEYILGKINDVLDKYWDVEKHGVPVITITGDTKELDAGHTKCKIIIYTLGSTNYNNPKLWADELSNEFKWPNDKDILFLSRYNSTTDDFSMISDTLEFFLSWLEKVECSKVHRDTPEAKLDQIMHNWYKPEEYNTLVKLSEQTISNFVVTGEINIYIPGYLTIPSYHIRRYKKALDTIESLYKPKFVMTLPIYRGNTCYTVLFPICDDITADTVRR